MPGDGSKSISAKQSPDLAPCYSIPDKPARLSGIIGLIGLRPGIHARDPVRQNKKPRSALLGVLLLRSQPLVVQLRRDRGRRVGLGVAGIAVRNSNILHVAVKPREQLVVATSSSTDGHRLCATQIQGPTEGCGACHSAIETEVQRAPRTRHRYVMPGVQGQVRRHRAGYDDLAGLASPRSPGKVKLLGYVVIAKVEVRRGCCAGYASRERVAVANERNGARPYSCSTTIGELPYRRNRRHSHPCFHGEVPFKLEVCRVWDRQLTQCSKSTRSGPEVCRGRRGRVTRARAHCMASQIDRSSCATRGAQVQHQRVPRRDLERIVLVCGLPLVGGLHRNRSAWKQNLRGRTCQLATDQ